MSNQALAPIRLAPDYHNKNWGREIWLCNNDEFCGKILEIDAGSGFSVHFHVNKREVFYILEGKGILNWIDLETAERREGILEQGMIIEIPRLMPHQIIAESNMKVIEFSTHHEDSDSYRVEPGVS